MYTYPWRIQMLGGLQVSNGDFVVHRFRTTKSGALLSYLALFGNRVHPREELSARFWPEAAPEAARHNLRQELHTLRRQLSSPQSDATHLIQSDHRMVTLVRHVYTTDVAEMENLVRRAARVTDTPERIVLLEQALHLYQGELLSGYYDDWGDDENWLNEKRLYLAELYRQTLATLTQQEQTHQINHNNSHGETSRHDSNSLQQLGPPQPQPGVGATQAAANSSSIPPASASPASARVASPTPLLLSDTPLPSTPHAIPIPLTHLIGRCQDLAEIVAHLVGRVENEVVTQEVKVTRVEMTKEGREEKSHGATKPRAIHAEAIETSRALGALAAVRCLTLIGLGGIGKTRLALEVAHRLAARPDWEQHRITFVPLAEITDARLLIQSIAQALRLQPSGRDVTEQVMESLGREPTLLLLDNLEHLAAEAAPQIELLLQQVPTLQCLVTSHRLLRVAGEQPYRVQPLATTPPTTPATNRPPTTTMPATAAPATVWVKGNSREAGSQQVYQSKVSESKVSESRVSESVELFLERARATQCDFAITARNIGLVHTLCVTLEGIPLSIELVAARIGMMTLTEMVEGLQDRLSLLDTPALGTPEIDTTGKGSSERPVLESTFTKTTAKSRTARGQNHASAQSRESRHRSLRAVLDWSLALLPPAVRQFLLRLSVFQGSWTATAAAVVCREPQARDYLERLRLYSLISTTVTPAGSGRPAGSGTSIHRGVTMTATPETQSIAAQLEATSPHESPSDEMPLLALRFGMLETVRAYGLAQLAAEERQACAAAHAAFYHDFCEDSPANYAGRAKALKITQFEHESGNIRAALEWYATFETGGESGLRKALHMAHRLAPGYWFVRGYYREQRYWLERLLNRHQAGKPSPEGPSPGEPSSEGQTSDEPTPEQMVDLGRAYYSLGVAAIMQTDWEAAAPSLHAALEQFRALDAQADIGYTLNKLGVVAQHRGAYGEARALFERSQQICAEAGTRTGEAHALKCLGCLQLQQGESEGVRAAFEAALTIYREINDPVAICMMLTELSGLALQESQQPGRELAGRLTREARLTEAEALLAEALPLARSCHTPLHISNALMLRGRIAQVRGDSPQAERLFREAQEVRGQLNI